ncbi:hypothetical protein E2C01_102373 [Portunus trituberculatus]|uniref:Uncharacterized protein n=1 Tax=Portunus trituberculatus TaxID=210409 RepID=A0A5B7KID5_PORTR|nr:hypothetical protein [Portunus trituberculatus]
MTRNYFKSLSSEQCVNDSCSERMYALSPVPLFYFHTLKYKNMSEDQQKLAKKLIFDALSKSDMGDLTREHQVLRVEGSDKLMV